MRTACLTLGLAVLFALPARAGEEGKRPTAEEGFKAIQEVVKGADADMLEVVIPGKIQDRRMKDEEVAAWREKLARRIAKASLLRAREGGTEAVARFSSERGEESEIALHFTGTRWVVASPDAYQVRGRFLDTARGSSTAKATLVARTEKDRDYAKSAYSFAHVTGDPNLCKNRMNIWLDANCGQIHARGEGRIAVVPGDSPDKVDSIPVGVEWVQTATPEKGRVFVVHCKRPGTSDFFVACSVEAAAGDSVGLEWTLLAAGPGAPATIHKAQPLKSNDGMDGCDGMCGKAGEGGAPGSGGGSGKGGSGGRGGGK